jgi:preprotein translocase subunit SecE
MDRIRSYVMASYDELMHKVSWPTWEELQSSAIVVLIGTTIIAALVWIMDITAKLGLQELLYKKLFGH